MSTFEQLYHKYVNKSISQEETQQLFEMIAMGAYDPALHALIDETIQNLDEEIEVPETRAEQILTLILQMHPKRSKLVRLRPIIRWAAAAILLILAGTMAWLYRTGENNTFAKTTTPQTVSDILPAQAGAILKLADGSTIALDSLGGGVIATQSGTTITLANNELAYTDSDAGPVAYNTLTTPRGRLFHLVLPDGTKVWLNTESAITYPTRFTGDERVVELTGEAFFEVTTNKQMPFRVRTGKGTEVEVLGTGFNINAYKNEEAIKTTLLHGVVKVHAGEGKEQFSSILQPGQQAAVNPALNASPIQVHQVDTAQVMAWKNGIFNFENADIKTVMRQLERWYDIEVAYEKGVPDIRFGGKIGRDLTLQQVLRILEISKVHYSIEGKKVIIHP